MIIHGRSPSWLVGKNLSFAFQMSEYLVCNLSASCFGSWSAIICFSCVPKFSDKTCQTVLGLLKVNVELLLLFLGIEVKKWALGQTPPPRQRVQNFERLMSQQGAGVRSNFERKRGGRLRRSTSSCPPIPASAWREASWTGQ